MFDWGAIDNLWGIETTEEHRLAHISIASAGSKLRAPQSGSLTADHRCTESLVYTTAGRRSLQERGFTRSSESSSQRNGQDGVSGYWAFLNWR